MRTPENIPTSQSILWPLLDEYCARLKSWGDRQTIEEIEALEGTTLDKLVQCIAVLCVATCSLELKHAARKRRNRRKSLNLPNLILAEVAKIEKTEARAPVEEIPGVRELVRLLRKYVASPDITVLTEPRRGRPKGAFMTPAGAIVQAVEDFHFVKDGKEGLARAFAAGETGDYGARGKRSPEVSDLLRVLKPELDKCDPNGKPIVTEGQVVRSIQLARVKLGLAGDRTPER